MLPRQRLGHRFSAHPLRKRSHVTHCAGDCSILVACANPEKPTAKSKSSSASLTIPTILRKIRALGAASQGRLLEQNTLYDTPQSDLRRRGMLLRLRIETPAAHNARTPSRRERVILTSKAPPHQPRTSKRSHTRPRYKERAERELVVANSSRQWIAALTALGFRPAFRYDKYPHHIPPACLHLDLDETPVGSILELEGSPIAIDRAARKLGFTGNDYLRATYWDLYAADCRRRGIRPKNMLFRAK